MRGRHSGASDGDIESEHSDDLAFAYEQRTRQLHDARGALAGAVHALTVEISRQREERDQALTENRRLRAHADALEAELRRLREHAEIVSVELRGMHAHAHALDADRRALRHHAAALDVEVQAAREQNAVLRNLKVVRWTAWPRRIIYRLRARRRWH